MRRDHLQVMMRSKSCDCRDDDIDDMLVHIADAGCYILHG